MEQPKLDCFYRESEIHDLQYEECQYAPVFLYDDEIGEVTATMERDKNGNWVDGYWFYPLNGSWKLYRDENAKVKGYGGATVDEAVISFALDPCPDPDDMDTQIFVREVMRERGFHV